MKTTLHLHRHAPPAPRTHVPRPHVGPSVVRLGVVLSVVAAVLAVALEVATSLPVVFVLVPVVVVGFVLSWHASGRQDDPPPE